MGTTTATAGDHPAIATTKSTTTMNRMTAALLLLLLGTATATLVTAAPPKTRTIEILSSPIVLKYGEVHNRYHEPIPLPEDVVAQFANGTMAIVDYMLDVVYANGSRVPLTDIYQHHYIFTMGSEDTMKAYYKYMQDAPYGAKTDGLEGWVKGAKNPVDFAQEQKKKKVHNRKLMMSTMAMKAQLEEASKPANEKNYIVGMTPCVFDDPPVFKKKDKVRVVSRYNATEPHFGVMALFLGTLSD